MIHENNFVRVQGSGSCRRSKLLQDLRSEKMDKFKMLGYQVLINIVHKDLKVLVNNAD